MFIQGEVSPFLASYGYIYPFFLFDFVSESSNVLHSDPLNYFVRFLKSLSE
jgi:hypothetical protein